MQRVQGASETKRPEPRPSPKRAPPRLEAVTLPAPYITSARSLGNRYHINRAINRLVLKTDRCFRVNSAFGTRTREELVLLGEHNAPLRNRKLQSSSRSVRRIVGKGWRLNCNIFLAFCMYHFRWGFNFVVGYSSESSFPASRWIITIIVILFKLSLIRPHRDSMVAQFNAQKFPLTLPCHSKKTLPIL